MSLAATEFAAIDFESAGSFERGKTDCPIQIGIACMRGSQFLPETFFRSYLQADAREICLTNAVHRISPVQLVGAPSLMSLWPAVRDRLRNRCIVAHGAGTERRHLRIFPFHGFGPWIDTLKLTRILHPNLADYSLGALIVAFSLEQEMHQLCIGLNWHDALYDAVACLLLLRTLMDHAALWPKPLSVLESPSLKKILLH